SFLSSVTLFPYPTLFRSEVSPAEIQIEDGLYIAPGRAEDVEANLLCLNHSCNPNVGVRGQITFVAMRDVPAGAELTIDYAMIDRTEEHTSELQSRGHLVC